jgi:hypothetical protein
MFRFLCHSSVALGIFRHKHIIKSMQGTLNPRIRDVGQLPEGGGREFGTIVMLITTICT